MDSNESLNTANARITVRHEGVDQIQTYVWYPPESRMMCLHVDKEDSSDKVKSSQLEIDSLKIGIAMIKCHEERVKARRQDDSH